MRAGRRARRCVAWAGAGFVPRAAASLGTEAALAGATGFALGSLQRLPARSEFSISRRENPVARATCACYCADAVLARDRRPPALGRARRRTGGAHAAGRARPAGRLRLPDFQKQGFGLPFGMWAPRHAGLRALATDSLPSALPGGCVMALRRAKGALSSAARPPA
jgi:hypothetical protein